MQSLRWLSGAVGDLLIAVDGADAAPTSEARDGFAKLSPMADDMLAEWERFITTDLSALNAKLSAAGLKPIEADS
jgi:hypothetical protein